MSKENIEAGETDWIVGFTLGDSTYGLAEPHPFQFDQEILFDWPQSYVDGLRTEMTVVQDKGNEADSPSTQRRESVLCFMGVVKSNRQLVAEHCDISDDGLLTPFGDEDTDVWFDGPTEYYVWVCARCGVKQVDSPQDEWEDPHISCIECEWPHPFPWAEGGESWSPG